MGGMTLPLANTVVYFVYTSILVCMYVYAYASIHASVYVHTHVIAHFVSSYEHVCLSMCVMSLSLHCAQVCQQRSK